MIYIVIIASIALMAGIYLRVRDQGIRVALLDLIASALLGWLAGVLIGIGARIGMWSVPFFNGVESGFTLDGTFQVILLFSLFGIGLGLLYEFLLRRPLRERGSLFGLLITAVTAVPLAQAAIQQLSFIPSPLPTIFFTILFVGAMFVPFGIVIEQLIGRWHRFHASGASTIPVVGKMI